MRKLKWGAFALVAVNVLLTLELTIDHINHATKLLDWQDFLWFQGEQPFQSRVLPFLLTRALMLVVKLTPLGLAAFFGLLDLIGVAVCVVYAWKAAARYGLNGRGMWLMFALLWWQLFATFVISSVNNYYYPYDMMSMGFMSMALWMIVSAQPWRKLLVLCVLAMLNRETAIVIPFFYLAYNWPAKGDTRRHFAILLGACIAVKACIALALHASDQMATLEHIPGFPRYLYNFSFLTLHPKLVHTANAFFAFGFAWLLLLWRGRVPTPLRRMLLCFIPYFLGMVVVGNLSEIRIFAEFIPLMALGLAAKFMGRAAPAESPDQQAAITSPASAA